MPSVRSRTKRPRAALLQLGIVLGIYMCRIGGRLWSLDASLGGVIGEIPPLYTSCSYLDRYPVQGPCLVGSLTGAVALILTFSEVKRGRIWLYAGTSGVSGSTNLKILISEKLVKIYPVQTISREDSIYLENPQRLHAKHLFRWRYSLILWATIRPAKIQ